MGDAKADSVRRAPDLIEKTAGGTSEKRNKIERGGGVCERGGSGVAHLGARGIKRAGIPRRGPVTGWGIGRRLVGGRAARSAA